MHSNPTATRSLCCRSRRVEWLPPLHSASLYTFIFFSSLSLSLSLPLSPFPFLSYLAALEILYCEGQVWAPSPEKDERIAFHYTQLRVAHVRSDGRVKVDPHRLYVQRNTSFCLDPTHPGSTFYPRLSTTR